MALPRREARASAGHKLTGEACQPTTPAHATAQGKHVANLLFLRHPRLGNGENHALLYPDGMHELVQLPLEKAVFGIVVRHIRQRAPAEMPSHHAAEDGQKRPMGSLQWRRGHLSSVLHVGWGLQATPSGQKIDFGKPLPGYR